jgi:hypothetical protein
MSAIPVSPTSATTGIMDSPVPDKSFTKHLVAALSSTEVKESLNKMITEAVRSEVSACIRSEVQTLRETLSAEIRAITQPLEDRLTALEMEADRRFTVTSDQLDQLRDDRKSTDEKLRNFDRQHRASNLKITGLNLQYPAAQKGETRQNLQDLIKDKIMNTFTEAGIDGFHREDIVNVQTIKSPGQPSSYLLKLTNENRKLHLYRQRTKLKNCTTRVYMNEDLTPYDSKLFKMGRDQVKNEKLTSVWTLNGRVYAKKEVNGKPFLLRPDEDFNS